MENTPAKRTISQAVVRRLPRYYRLLADLLQKNVDRISSTEFAEIIGSSASQVRSDFSLFGEFGQQGYGYNVQYLYSEIGRILGIDRVHTMIIVGYGNLGHALCNHKNFYRRGFLLQGIFDNSPEVIGKKVNELTVLSTEALPDFLKMHRIDIAVLCIPSTHAKEVAGVLSANGVRGIWNFSSTDLSLEGEDVEVENVYLTESLLTLSYKLTKNEDNRQRIKERADG